MPKTVQLEENLRESQFERLLLDLRSLPTTKEFKDHVESDLWEIITGQSNPDEKVNYTELADKGKKLIGTTSSDSGETNFPWWLTEFKWKATSTGEGQITLNNTRNLSTFKNFVAEQTVIRKPELERSGRGSNDIYCSLKNFNNIQEEFEKHLNVEKSESELDVPQNIFSEQDRGIQTTSEFRDWFNSLVSLCPPFDEQLTALLILNTKVNEDLARERLSDEVMTSIEKLGIVSNGEIYNSAYFEPIASKSYSSHRNKNHLLTYDWKVFDLQVPYLNEEYDHLAPLEAALFESWVENNKEVAERYYKYLKNFSITSETDYAHAALQSPVVKERGKSKFVTLRQIKDKSLSASSGRKLSELCEILERHGIAHE